jgi:hypothetical protein
MNTLNLQVFLLLFIPVHTFLGIYITRVRTRE